MNIKRNGKCVFYQVANQDDTPVQDDLNEVAVRWGFHHDTANYETTTYSIPEDGIIELKFNPPIDAPADVLGIEAEYKEHVQWFSTGITQNHRLNNKTPTS